MLANPPCSLANPGLGKTCILRALRSRLPEAGFKLTYCHNATLGRRDFYRQLCLALGLHPKASAAGLFFTIATHSEQLGHERLHPVFLLDEAHLLHQDVLDHIHILLNYQWDSRALLSVILVGLPDLWDRLELRRNRSLYSRIATRQGLNPNNIADTTEYLAHRLRAAECSREIFASDAVSLLHEAALGALRDIDRLATACLKSAARRKTKIVDRALFLQVLDAQHPARDC